MLCTKTWKDASVGRHVHEHAEFEGIKTEYMETTTGTRPAPQAFLIEQKPGWTVRPHFHMRHQFQLVVAGGGTLGRHEVSPFEVHYATPESAYGPVVAGPSGLSYFTLRAMNDNRNYYMPEGRVQMQPGLTKQQFTGHATLPPQLQFQSVKISECFPSTPNGVAAWMVCVPPGVVVQAPSHPNGGGRFHIVAQGGMVLSEQKYGKLSVIWASGEDELTEFAAGPEGLALVVMQYPAEALRV